MQNDTNECSDKPIGDLLLLFYFSHNVPVFKTPYGYCCFYLSLFVVLAVHKLFLYYSYWYSVQFFIDSLIGSLSLLNNCFIKNLLKNV